MDELFLLLIRGLPGSGKTTLAELLGLPFCEADQYFEEFNEGIFDASLLSRAHEYCVQQTINHLENGESVIVSNTSTMEKEVAIYEELAEEFDAKFISVIVEDRHNSGSLHPVPPMTLDRMRRRFTINL